MHKDGERSLARHTTQADRNLYAAVMTKVKLRIDEAAVQLHSNRLDERNVVYAGLQLRLAIEEVAFSSFVANRQALADASRSTRAKAWDEARKALTSVNPNYWPVGVQLIQETGAPDRWVTRTEQLTEADCGPAWGHLSSLLHARDPSLPVTDLKREATYTT